MTESALASRKTAGKEAVAFYRARDFRLGWISHGNPVSGAWQLLSALRTCDREGLNPADYHIDAIDSLLGLSKRKFFWRTPLQDRPAVDLDLLLTSTYLTFANHLLSGRIRSQNMDDVWHISREPLDLAAYLNKTLDEGNDIRESLVRLAPPQVEYGKLKYWLEAYRQLQLHGGWQAIPEGPALAPGSQGPRVAMLCRRLQAEGYAPWEDCPEVFTPALGEAVKKFQMTHGLDPDGVAAAATLRELNIPIKARINQIKLNLDCWRWLPQNLGDRHIRVNIADFRLGAFEGGREALSMRVVVGRKADSTPVFSDRAVAVSLNPSWNVPADIARDEMLPELKKDPSYLAKHDMELLSDWSDAAKTLKADSIDWSRMDSSDFKFRVRQKFGDASALGRVKIVLTNPFNIYLHDTPAKKFFEQDKRALSHGCVRLQDPVGLAAWILGPESDWTLDRLKTEIDKGDPVYITIKDPGIPVHILYWTAFVDKDGGMQFRPDVYGWEKRLETGLRSKPEAP